MINININSFGGIHCETTATGVLLSHAGINLSEPMIFGIGQGLGYGFIKFGKMPFPFIAGRCKTFELTKNVCSNLGLNLNVHRTTSLKKALNNVKIELDNNTPVGLQLDSYYLDYFSNKIHFAGHFVAMIGYDNKYAYLIDANQQGKYLKTTLESLILARSSKEPMSDKNMSYTITKPDNFNIDIKEVLKKAIVNNANDFLNPPIKNFGYKGIIKTSQEIKKYFHLSENIREDFSTTAMLMEKAGTGGAIFRNMYSNFLKESYEILKDEKIYKAHKLFVESSILWTKVSSLFDKVSDTNDISYLEDASEVLLYIHDLELEAMKLLSTI